MDLFFTKIDVRIMPRLRCSCLVNFADIEMKLGLIVYNNELQIKFSFVKASLQFCPFYWADFDPSWACSFEKN
jgi:hypothetical protein